MLRLALLPLERIQRVIPTPRPAITLFSPTRPAETTLPAEMQRYSPIHPEPTTLRLDSKLVQLQTRTPPAPTILLSVINQDRVLPLNSPMPPPSARARSSRKATQSYLGMAPSAWASGRRLQSQN